MNPADRPLSFANPQRPSGLWPMLLAMALSTASPAVAQSTPAAAILNGVPDLSSADVLSKPDRGARVQSVPSNPAAAIRLIDGNVRDGWQASQPFDGERPPRIVVDLGSPVSFDRILIHPRHWQPGARSPSSVSVAAIDMGGQERPIGSWTLADAEDFQLISFPGVSAQYVILTILDVHQAGRPGIGELAVLATGSALTTLAVRGPGAQANAPLQVLAQLAANSPAPPPAAAACPPREPRLAQPTTNGVLSVGVEAFCIRDAFEGTAAAAGRLFAVVQGRIGNENRDRALLAGPLDGTLLLQIDGGQVALVSPSFAKRAASFLETPLQPGERRSFTIAFEVPKDVGRATLIHPGAAGVLALPLLGEVEVTPSQPSRRALWAGAEVTLTEETRTESAEPAAHDSLMLDLVIAKQGTSALNANPAEFATLEDARGETYQPDAAGSGAFAAAPTFFPGVPVLGRLTFRLPKGAAPAFLVLEEGSNRSQIPLGPAAIVGDVDPRTAAGPDVAQGASVVAPALRLGGSALNAVDRPEVNFDGFPGHQQDWVAVAVAGGADDKYLKYFYTEGQKSGRLRFDPLPAGTYEARGYFDWPNGGYKVEVRAPFEVKPATVATAEAPSSPPTVTVAKPLLSAQDAPVLAFANFPGNAKDWVAIALAGAADDKYLRFFYTDGQASGEFRFDPLPPGRYEARAYFNWPDGGNTVQLRTPFEVVTNASISGGGFALARSSLSEDDDVTVVWHDFPADGFLALAPVRAPDYGAELPHGDIVGVKGGSNWRHVFGPHAPGDYELRGYVNKSGGAELVWRLAATIGRTGSASTDALEPGNPLVAGLRNLAARSAGAFVEGGKSVERMVDGNAIDYDDEGTYIADPRRPNRVWLARPSTIARVRFLLWDGDARTYRYKLRGSPDGVSWTDLAASTNATGWQDIDAGGRSFIAFELTELGTSAQDGRIPIVEFAAYSPEAGLPLPPLALPPLANIAVWQGDNSGPPINVANPLLGAVASGGVGPQNLIDGDFTDGGRAEAGVGEPLTVTFADAYALNSVEVHLLATGGRTYRYRLEGSGDHKTWQTLADFSQKDQSGQQRIALGGQTVSAIRLVGTAAPAGEPFRVIEIAAIATGTLPVSGVAARPALQNETAMENLALAEAGGRIESVNGRPPTSSAIRRDGQHDGLNLTDGLISDGWQAADATLPQTLVLSFSRRAAALVDGVDLYNARDGSAPALVDISAADESSNSWRRIGRYLVLPPADCGPGCIGVQRIRFAATQTRALQVTILATHSERPVGLAEIVIHEARGDGYASVLPYRPRGFAGGVNIAGAVVGGTVAAAVPAAEYKENGPQTLIDGVTSGGGFWAPSENPTIPAITLAMAGGASARIGGVAFAPNGGTSNFAVPGNARWTSLVDVWASNESATAGFKWIGRYRLDQADRVQVLAFEPVVARYVRVLLLDTHGNAASLGPAFGGAVLGEIEVLEAPNAASPSILRDRPPNILDARYGGHVAIAGGARRADLIDSSSASPGWSTQSSQTPAILTFGFKNSQARGIAAVGFNPKTAADRKSWARRVAVLVSDLPNQGFKQIGEFQIAPEDRLQYFDVPPLTARFVRVQILETVGGGPLVSLGEVAVKEAVVAGQLASIARRIVPLAYDETGPAAGNPLPPAAVFEAERNDTQATANAMPLDRLIGGRVGMEGDVDWFAFDTSAGATDSLTLTVEERPALRSSLELRDAAGRLIGSKALPDLGRERAALSIAAPRGKYFVKLSQAANAIVFVVDTSGSVGSVRGDIATAAASFADAIGPGDVLSFTSMDGKVYNDFTNDRVKLRATAAETKEGGGGSAVYQSLLDGIGRLQKRGGAKAIVIVTDGDDQTGERGLAQLWQSLMSAGTRIYCVGYGEAVTTQLDGDRGETGGDVLRNFALASGGRYYYAPTGAEMGAIYTAIESDLVGESEYRLTAHVGGPGLLAVETTGEPIVGVAAPARIALVLDASGSMLEKLPDGRTKMAAAKEALNAVVDRLPEGTQVALRVYGHRLPSVPHDKSCLDSELVVPFGPLNRASLKRIVEGINPRGETPIGLSLALLYTDFGKAPGRKVVVLITDGIESCDPKPTDKWYPPSVMRDLRLVDVDVRVNIVGFDIPEKDATTRDFLKNLATLGAGQYYDAAGATQLSAALNNAFKATFTVSDAFGKRVASGKAGEAPVSIPEGRWRATLEADPVRDLGEVTIQEGKTVRLQLRRSGGQITQSQTIGP